MSSLSIRRASTEDIDALAPLFDAYRRFYRQPGDVALASAYLHARLQHDESIVLMAEAQGSTLCFCRLSPAWCSLAVARTFVLHDLYVDPACRRSGVARALMLAAQEFARTVGAVRRGLGPARTTVAAQSLYESLGWRRDEVFLGYSWTP